MPFDLKSILALQLILMISTISSEAQTPALETVSFVNLEKYAGKWFEIASFPQRFQMGCHCTTATYTIHEKGHVVVENRCRKNSTTGRISYIKGKAFVEPNSGNAKLKVQFFWPFRGKYWIIDLADDYSYAVVGHPNRQYLWILSRTPKMESDLYNQILQRLEKKGFKTSMLLKTDQNCQ
jgi:apolipoprotein D and lipocalin family protein